MPNTAQHTPASGFTGHLFDLADALDKVQPLADYRGNLDALHALLVLKKAMDQVARDIAPFIGELAMDLESELGGWHDECEMCFAGGVELVRYRPYGSSAPIFICRNCQADLRDMQKERLQP